MKITTAQAVSVFLLICLLQCHSRRFPFSDLFELETKPPLENVTEDEITKAKVTTEENTGATEKPLNNSLMESNVTDYSKKVEPSDVVPPNYASQRTSDKSATSISPFQGTLPELTTVNNELLKLSHQQSSITNELQTSQDSMITMPSTVLETLKALSSNVHETRKSDKELEVTQIYKSTMIKTTSKQVESTISSEDPRESKGSQTKIQITTGNSITVTSTTPNYVTTTENNITSNVNVHTSSEFSKLTPSTIFSNEGGKTTIDAIKMSTNILSEMKSKTNESQPEVLLIVTEKTEELSKSSDTTTSVSKMGLDLTYNAQFPSTLPTSERPNTTQTKSIEMTSTNYFQENNSSDDSLVNPFTKSIDKTTSNMDLSISFSHESVTIPANSSSFLMKYERLSTSTNEINTSDIQSMTTSSIQSISENKSIDNNNKTNAGFYETATKGSNDNIYTRMKSKKYNITIEYSDKKPFSTQSSEIRHANTQSANTPTDVSNEDQLISSTDKTDEAAMKSIKNFSKIRNKHGENVITMDVSRNKQLLTTSNEIIKTNIQTMMNQRYSTEENKLTDGNIKTEERIHEATTKSTEVNINTRMISEIDYISTKSTDNKLTTPTNQMTDLFTKSTENQSSGRITPTKTMEDFTTIRVSNQKITVDKSVESSKVSSKYVDDSLLSSGNGRDINSISMPSNTSRSQSENGGVSPNKNVSFTTTMATLIFDKEKKITAYTKTNGNGIIMAKGMVESDSKTNVPYNIEVIPVTEGNEKREFYEEQPKTKSHQIDPSKAPFSKEQSQPSAKHIELKSSSKHQELSTSTMAAEIQYRFQTTLTHIYTQRSSSTKDWKSTTKLYPRVTTKTMKADSYNIEVVPLSEDYEKEIPTVKARFRNVDSLKEPTYSDDKNRQLKSLSQYRSMVKSTITNDFHQPSQYTPRNYYSKNVFLKKDWKSATKSYSQKINNFGARNMARSTTLILRSSTTGKERKVARTKPSWLVRDPSLATNLFHPVCTLDVDEGSGSDTFSSWFYNEVTRRCEWFSYRGQDGNGNRFNYRANCENYCIEKQQDLCSRMDIVNCEDKWLSCKMEYDKFCHNDAEANNKAPLLFCPPEQPICIRERGSFRRPPLYLTHRTMIPRECNEPKDHGLCQRNSNSNLVFHYDPKYNDCFGFLYSNCGGNSNRFATKQECMNHCAF